MSGGGSLAPVACVTGATLTDPTLCSVLNEARSETLAGSDIQPATPVSDSLLPSELQTAISGCGDTCKLVSYDFETNTADKFQSVQYVVDTYTHTVQNSAVLVKKDQTSVSGTITNVTPSGDDTVTTITYTVNGTSYSFSYTWKNLRVVNGSTITVYYDPVQPQFGSVSPLETKVPPQFDTPPGYKTRQDFLVNDQPFYSITNLSTVDECAKACDDSFSCVAFNFGGLDATTVCELTSSSDGTRGDNKTGFVKEQIPTSQTGDGTNPTGTDLTNQGSYCEDYRACNAEMTALIQATQVDRFTTTDVKACRYCPVRSYRRMGHVTTNEIGISKTHATPQGAIDDLMYTADGTFATHTVTFESGKLYEFKNYTSSLTFNYIVYRDGNLFKLLNVDMFIFVGTVDLKNDKSSYIVPGNVRLIFDPTPINVELKPCEYVTDGYHITINGVIHKVSSLNYNVRILVGGNFAYGNESSTYIFEPISDVNIYSNEYKSSIFTIKEIPIDTIFNTTQTFTTYPPDSPEDKGSSAPQVTFYRPPIFINPSNEYFLFTSSTQNKILARKIDTNDKLESYIEVLPNNIYGFWPYIRQWQLQPWVSGSPYQNPLNKISEPIVWANIEYGVRAPDPYAALFQFKTLDVGPPPRAVDWDSNNKRGCDRSNECNDRFGTYDCKASGGGNCDPRIGAYVSGSLCSGTYVSCLPDNNSQDMMDNFSFQLSGLRTISTYAISGITRNSNPTSVRTHGVYDIRLKSLYRLDVTQSFYSVVNSPLTDFKNLFSEDTRYRIEATNWNIALRFWRFCPIGYSFNSSDMTCTPCNTRPGTGQVFGEGCNIVTCSSGTVPNARRSRCVYQCPTGQSFNEVIDDCEPTTCASFDTTGVLSMDLSQFPTLIRVIDGTPDSNGCRTPRLENCPLGTHIANSDNTACVPICGPGTTLVNGQCATCQITPGPNQIWQKVTPRVTGFDEGYTCSLLTCTAPRTPNSNKTSCSCPMGTQYNSTTRVCDRCPDNLTDPRDYWLSDTWNGGTTCRLMRCNISFAGEGSYVNERRTACISQCPPSYVNNDSTLSQLAADPVYTGLTGVRSCTKCTSIPAGPLETYATQKDPNDPTGQAYRNTCVLTLCPDGQEPYGRQFRPDIFGASATNCTACAPPTGLPAGVTAQYGQGCRIVSCSTTVPGMTVIADTQPEIPEGSNCPQGCPVPDTYMNMPGNSPEHRAYERCVLGRCTPIGRCVVTGCGPGTELSDNSCISCPTTQGILTTFSSGCTASACAIDPTVDAHIVAVGVQGGRCVATQCQQGYALSNGECVACPSSTDHDDGTIPVYTVNTCTVTSCGVQAAFSSIATASYEDLLTWGGPSVKGCKLKPNTGYYTPMTIRTMSNGFDRNTVATDVLPCPEGDPGTITTYDTTSDPSVYQCNASCALTTPSTTEIAYRLIDGFTPKCKKVCRPGYTRGSSGVCDTPCPAQSDPGLTVTYTYGCVINTCTSRSGFNTSISSATWSGYYTTTNDTCTVICGYTSGLSVQWDPTNNMFTCLGCTTDKNIDSYGSFNPGTCTIRSTGCVVINPAAATVSTSGGTCVATCKAGYVKDSFGICRKCPGEIPSATSAVQNGVCVTTCKANHSRDASQDATNFENIVPCTTCSTTDYFYATVNKMCANKNGTTTYTASQHGSALYCVYNRFFNYVTGTCDACTERSTGLDDPGTKLNGFDNGSGGCSYQYRNNIDGNAACQVLPTAVNIGSVSYDNVNYACRSTCVTGYTKDASGVCNQCAEGYRWSGTACVACSSGSTIASGPASGTARSCTCQTGRTGASCDQCATNYTFINGACVSCKNGSTLASGPAELETCENNPRCLQYPGAIGIPRQCACTSSAYTAYDCSQCAADYYWNGSACTRCPVGLQSGGPASGPATSCTYLKDGFEYSTVTYDLQGNVISRGPLVCKKYYAWNGTDSCLPCNNTSSSDGQKTITGGSVGCLCNTGYTGLQCKQCATTHYRVYSSFSGSVSCSQCPANSSGSGDQLFTETGPVPSDGSCSCNTGYKWNTQQCVQCPTGSSSNGNLQASGSENYCTCQQNYIWNGTACTACPTGAITSTTTVEARTVSPAATCICPTNYRWTGTACVACINGGTATSGSASGPARSCTCPTGYKGSRCETCADNYAWTPIILGTPGYCSACLNDGKASNIPASGSSYGTCTCPSTWSGYLCQTRVCFNGSTHDPGTNTCSQCPTGYTGSSCEQCATNYTWNGTACVACQNGGTAASGPAIPGTGGRSCTCSSGHWTGTRCETACTVSAGYKWSSSSGCETTACTDTTKYCPGTGNEISCTVCTTGQYTGTACTRSSDTTCGTCPTGSTGNGTTCTCTNVTNAVSTTWNSTANWCIPRCAAGYMRNGPTASCVACTAGYYCPEGTEDLVYSANRPIAYTTCAAGNYISTAGTSTSNRVCTACEAGSYQDETDKTSCKPCTAGTYQDETGKTSCKPCTAGTYQDETGKTSCKTCRTCMPAGLYGSYTSSCSSTGQTADATCTFSCNSGYQEISGTCLYPVPSEYRHNEKACLIWVSYPTTCTNINSVLISVRNSIPPQQQCAAAPSCRCPAGRYITSTGQCIDCPSGFYSYRNYTYCMKEATASYSCGQTIYSLSGTNCVANQQVATWYGRVPTSWRCPVSPSGTTIVNTCTSNNRINCCSFPALVSYSCPSGSTLNGTMCEYRGTATLTLR